MRFILCLLFLVFACNVFGQPNYNKTWATYFGDQKIKIFDSAIDANGNIYVIGKVISSPFEQFEIATTNAHQTEFGGGTSDGFIAKFDPDGEFIWGSYFGGENDDALQSISIDKFNNIYCLGGTNSTQNIASPEAFQPVLAGDFDTFIVKFNPQGGVIWSTYYGGINTEWFENVGSTTANVKSIVNDGGNHFYISFVTVSDLMATPGVFQQTRDDANNVIAKFLDNGTLVWATYYGINAAKIAALDVTESGLMVYGTCNDCPPIMHPNSYFATSGCHQPVQGSCADSFLSKFSFDGQRIWSTYYGGVSKEFIDNNSLKCENGFIYIAGWTSSSVNITTPDSFQPTKLNTTLSNYLVKFDEEGNRIWGTYIGEGYDLLQSNSYTESKLFVKNGNIWLHGGTHLPSNISSPNSFQPDMIGESDGFIVKFNVDGQREWGTYFGGNINDGIYNLFEYDNALLMVGRTMSETGIATLNSYQPNFMMSETENLYERIENIFLARLDPNPLSTTEINAENLGLFPNPNNGIFSIISTQKTITAIIIYDINGKMVYQANQATNEIDFSNQAKGLYLVKAIFDDNSYETKKMLLK